LTSLLIKLAQPVAQETGEPPFPLAKPAGKNQIGPDRNFMASKRRDLPPAAGTP
jgi:hypothetical protein